MLKLRVLTALILIPLVILGIFFLPRPFFVLFTVPVFMIAAWEWAGLSGWTSSLSKLLYMAAIILAMIGINHLSSQSGFMAIAIGAFWWLLVIAWLIKARRQARLTILPRWLIACSGFFVLLPCWHAILWLQHTPFLFFYMLLMIWICDSAAYFAGRRWGKRKLAPTISPNKTIEGFYAGIIVTVLCSVILVLFIFKPEEPVLVWLLPVLPLIVAAVAGDLFESALKRMQNLKDSGRLLPGHGGMLDRIDSLTAGAPVFACVVIYLQQVI